MDPILLCTHPHTYTVVRVYDVFLEKPISEEGVAIKIPREVLGSGGPRVRMASFLFRNMSGLLPGSIEGTDDTRLVKLTEYVDH